MADYQIIDKDEMPAGRGRWGEWQELLRQLPFHKVVVFTFATKNGCKTRRTLFQSKSYRGNEYRILTRLLPDGDKWQLYIWKEKKEK